MTETRTRKFTHARMARVPQSPKAEIFVDQKTIADAISRNSSHCMIAEAVKKAIPYAQNVMVDLQSIRLTDKERGLRYTYLTPRLAQLALIKFDQGERPNPFKILLAKGSVRRASPRADTAAIPVPLDDRLRIISDFQDARTKRRMSLDEIGDATDIAPRSLERYVSVDPPLFSRMVAEKLEAWTAGKPVPHRRPLAVPASLVSGRPRMRDRKDRGAPLVVGGMEPPVGNIARRRGFGLHSMVL